MHTKGDRMVKRGTIRLGEEGIRNTRINGQKTWTIRGSHTTTQTRVEVRSKEEETRASEDRKGSAFRQRDSEGLGDMQNKNWANGEVMRGRRKSAPSSQLRCRPLDASIEVYDVVSEWGR